MPSESEDNQIPPSYQFGVPPGLESIPPPPRPGGDPEIFGPEIPRSAFDWDKHPEWEDRNGDGVPDHLPGQPGWEEWFWSQIPPYKG